VLVGSHPRTIRPLTELIDPFVQKTLVDPEVPRHLTDRHLATLRQSHSFQLELVRMLTSIHFLPRFHDTLSNKASTEPGTGHAATVTIRPELIKELKTALKDGLGKQLNMSIEALLTKLEAKKKAQEEAEAQAKRDQEYETRLAALKAEFGKK